MKSVFNKPGFFKSGDLKKSLLFLAIGIILAALPFIISPGQSGVRQGNGGDHVRAMFFKTGEAVLHYLNETQSGADLIARHGLDLTALEKTLSIDVVKVEEGALIDNGGASVDALGALGSIQLKKDAWIEYFESEADITYLVFHEMLRAIAVNDDNYAISKALLPFPSSRREFTRIASRIPLIAQDEIASFTNVAALQVGGTGCPTQLDGTVTDFDSETNEIAIRFRRYNAYVDASRPLSRLNCQLSLPVAAPAGRRLVVTQIDVSGTVGLAPGARTDLRVEGFLTGSSANAGTGSSELKSVQAPSSHPIAGRVLIRKTDLLKTACGGSDTLRLTTSMLLAGNQRDASQAEIRKVRISLKSEPCTSRGR